MRKKLGLSLLMTIIALTLVLPVQAQRVDYKAGGKLVTYGGPPSSAEVVNGHWRVVVKGDDVDFQAYYRERNLVEAEEESPVGTIDLFWITLTDGTAVIDGDQCEITGTFYVRKKMWTLPDDPRGYPIIWLDPQHEPYGTVTINAEGISWDFHGNMEGTTLSIQY